MKITKFNQSCLLVEDSSARVLFDISAQDKDCLTKIGKLDAVIFTHEHGDHFDAHLANLLTRQGVPVYANESTANLFGCKNIVKGGQELAIGGMKVKTVELPHCPMPDGSAGPQNTGYVVNDKFFHPGDGRELAGLSVQVLAVPIAGPDISIRDAFDFAKQVSAKDVIPIHYDMMSAKPDFAVRVAGIYHMPFNLHPLSHGQSADF